MSVQLYRNAPSVFRQVSSLPNRLPLGKKSLHHDWYIELSLGRNNVGHSHAKQFFSRISYLLTGIVVHLEELARQSVLPDRVNEDRIRNAIENETVVAFRPGHSLVCLLNRRLSALALRDVFHEALVISRWLIGIEDFTATDRNPQWGSIFALQLALIAPGSAAFLQQSNETQAVVWVQVHLMSQVADRGCGLLR
jgi:hypothetical protein